MSFVIADRVRETTLTTGTGTVTLAGAYTGFQAFSAGIGSGNSTYYAIANVAAGQWEVGIGTYTSGANTLSRTTVLASSNAGSLVNFTNTPNDVFVTQPAERALYVSSGGTGLTSGVAAFTANGVAYASSTTGLATGSALTFDGTNLGIGGSPVSSKGQLQVGTIGYTDTGVLAGFASSVAGYNQVILQNTNSGSTASTNFNVSNDQGSATTNYGEFGINSSGFSGSGFSTAGWTYLASASTDLAIGTYGSNAIHFIVNSGTTDAMTISSAGAVSLPGGTANGVAYLNGSKVLTTGSALTFDGTTLTATAISDSGNLTFTGTGNRITGDFTNATLTNRTAFITSTANSSTGIYALPNGTSTAASWQATNASDPTNASKILIATNGSTDCQLVSGINGTGTYLPLTFYTGGSERMRVDTSGNVGIGTSSFAFSAAGRGDLEINGSTDSVIGLKSNGTSTGYFQATSSIFNVVAASVPMQIQSTGANYIASFTNGVERMRIDSSGNVGIGTSSPNGLIDVTSNANSTARYYFRNTNAGTGAYTILDLGNDTSNSRGELFVTSSGNTSSWGSNSLVLSNSGAYPILFSTNNAERARIDSSGNLLVGTTSQIGAGRVNVLATSATNGIICQQVNNGNTVFSGFNAAGSTTFYVVGGGQIYSTSTSIAAISDQSQKENVVDIPYGLTTIQQLRPVKFDFKEGCASEEKDLLGFIAQEVENVIPELVKPFGEDGLLGLKMGDMLPVLVKAIQELNATITDLQAKLKSAGVAGF